jgi:molybdopterin converting factor small subunit
MKGEGEGPEGGVRVRLFAAYREVVGVGTLEEPGGAGLTVAELWERLLVRHPGLKSWPPSAAVNARTAAATTRLCDGDEVAFLPPVSGG